MAYWFLRSEPEVYGWDHLVRDGGTVWDGIRNYTARNFLKDMQVGDQAILYHSNTEKACAGIMEITRTWKRRPGWPIGSRTTPGASRPS